MLTNFLFIFNQSLILFLLIIVGYFSSKYGLITDEGEKTLANFILYLAVPCVILKSFSDGFDSERLYGFVLASAISLLTYILAIILTKLTLHDKNKEYESTVRFCTIFPNVGLFCIPIAESMYGAEGIFYCISQMVMFNIISWTYGYWLMGKTGSSKIKLSPKKIFLNPGVLFVFVGLIVFFTSFRIPSPLLKTIDYLSAIYVPIGMLIIGHRITSSGFQILKRKDIHWLAALEKLVIIPIIITIGLYLAGIRGCVAIIVVMASCAPAGSTATMFGILFGHDEDTSAGIVTYQTLMALVTMSVFLTIAQAVLV